MKAKGLDLPAGVGVNMDAINAAAGVGVNLPGVDTSQDERPAASQSGKYGNIPTEVDGVEFASAKEARRYGVLKIMAAAGVIRELVIHPKYVLEVNGKRICSYTADFAYIDVATGTLTVEDVKSEATRKKESYRLKRKLMKAVHGIEIKEV